MMLILTRAAWWLAAALLFAGCYPKPWIPS